MPAAQGAIQFGKATPFAEQLEFFRNKLNLPTDAWDDIIRQAHDRAFVVAGVSQADLLNDLRESIDKAIGTGSGIREFRKDFKEIVQKHGWTGWTGEGSAGGEAWRTRVIYTTNMSTSYAAGRYRQLMDPGLLSLRPYWQYIHSDSVLHPRPMHLAWNGLVLHHTDPFWKAHYPPNGWGCQCRVRAASQAEFEAALAKGKAMPPETWNKTDAKTGAPVGIDKGFDYAPGAHAATPLADLVNEKLFKLSAPIGAKMYEAMQPVLRAELRQAYTHFLTDVLADAVKRGRMAVPGAIDAPTLNWLAVEKNIVPATAEIVVDDALIVGRKAQRHVLAGDALTPGEWAKLPDMLESPDQIVFDTRTGKLLYLIDADGADHAKLAVEFDFKLKKGKGDVNKLVSAFHTDSETIRQEIEAGILQVVK